MSDFAYATTHIQWKESSQIPTLGKLTGEITGMLRARTFHIVWVSANHGVGIASTAQPDVVVQYKGDAVKTSSLRKAFSIFNSMCSRLCRFSGRFLPSSWHAKIEWLIKPYLLRTFYGALADLAISYYGHFASLI
jgi:hypothetical protein